LKTDLEKAIRGFEAAVSKTAPRPWARQ